MTAAGSYTPNSAGHTQAFFIASQVNGTWHPAIEVPGTYLSSIGLQRRVGSVSCPMVHLQRWWSTDSACSHPVLSSTKSTGSGGTAREVPGTGALTLRKRQIKHSPALRRAPAPPREDTKTARATSKPPTQQAQPAARHARLQPHRDQGSQRRVTWSRYCRW